MWMCISHLFKWFSTLPVILSLARAFYNIAFAGIQSFYFPQEALLLINVDGNRIALVQCRGINSHTEGILLLYFSLHNNFSTMDAHWDDMNFSCLLWRKKIYRFQACKSKLCCQRGIRIPSQACDCIAEFEKMGHKFLVYMPSIKVSLPRLYYQNQLCILPFPPFMQQSWCILCRNKEVSLWLYSEFLSVLFGDMMLLCVFY